MSDSTRSKIIEKLKTTLSRGRFLHSLRVEETALRLGEKYRVNKKKVSLAALLHDYAKRQPDPKLLHAKLGAKLAAKEFGIRSKEILDAIRHHTTGGEKMTKLEKIIYLADHMEAGRDFPGVKKLRRLAFTDLDKAVCLSATLTLEFLLRKNLPIALQTIKTRNSYLNK
ncbi:MAG: bis(5'-nucleosyl)-tetraphosphatase (symmetrical) YqeK [bacterium]